MPLVMLEAMAAGLPVVATDVPGSRETLGETGVLARPIHSLLRAPSTSWLADRAACRARQPELPQGARTLVAAPDRAPGGHVRGNRHHATHAT